MLKRGFLGLALVFVFLFVFFACKPDEKDIKLGVSMGVGAATRWDKEMMYMETHATSLGMSIETRLNRGEGEKTQLQDCFELIDSGIDVLILTPKDVNQTEAIIDYAKKNGVAVVSYARAALGRQVDLFVGYDNVDMGKKMAQYLLETVDKGVFIILKGDGSDKNATLLHQGAMDYIRPLKSDIRIILEAEVAGWSPAVAQDLVRTALVKNNKQIDGIFAPNDKIAGACVEVLEELGITTPVIITGTDAELDAVKRIVAGSQACTIYLDLKKLAETAINEALHLARGEKTTSNAEFDNHSGSPVPAHLITGQLVVKENIDRLLIDSGYLTHEQVYGAS